MLLTNRFFWAKITVLILMAMLIGGCASSPKKELPTPPGGIASRIQSDTALFQDGYSLLGTTEKPVDYEKAREIFDRLVKNHPKSKWRPYAETYLKLLGELKSVAAGASSDRMEIRRMQLEINELKASLDQSKKAYRTLQDKIQGDAAKLQQENEQLKNDLQRLKQLEIELQRRDRSAR